MPFRGLRGLGWGRRTGPVLFPALASGSAYLASAWADSKLSSHAFNDLKLVGQVFTTRSPQWQVQGVAAHYGFSVVVTLLYALHFYPRLPGPRALRGVAFMQLENALLYPAAVPLEARHAGIRAGELPSLFIWKSYWGQVLRHVVFGLVLGLTYRDKR